MWTVTFWKQAVERALKTGAQAILALWAVGEGLFNIIDVNWGQTFGVTAGALVISLLMSVLSAGIGPATSPSLVSLDDVPARRPDVG